MIKYTLELVMDSKLGDFLINLKIIMIDKGLTNKIDMSFLKLMFEQY